MKKIIYIVSAAIAIACITGCGKTDKEMKITLNQDKVTITQDEPATITYKAEENSSDITVQLKSTETSISIQNTFNSKTSEGQITFTTTSSSSSENNSTLTFSDGKSSVDKQILITIDSSWSIVPGEPEQGEETN